MAGARAQKTHGRIPVYKDASRPVEERVGDLLSRMTLEEKVMQLNQYTLGRNDNANNMADPVNDIPAEIGSLIYYGSSPELRNRVQRKAVEESRLGIPILFGHDVIHGFRTTYPISLAQACSWNPGLVEKAAGVAAQEARMSGVDWTFSPMIDVARDPRWGRVVECYGEDPFLIAELGVEMVRGIQSQGVASTLKHYAAYSVPKGGRDGNCRTDPHIAPRELHQMYLYPFRRVIREARPMGVMSSYNDWDGVPVTASRYFLTDLLRHEYGFDGYVVSDSEAVEYVHTKHAVAETYEEACLLYTSPSPRDRG